MQACLEEIGIKLKISALDKTTYLAAVDGINVNTWDIAYRASRKTPLVSSGLVTITTKYTDNGLLCGVPFSGAAKEMCEKANQARITSSQELLDQVYAALMEQVWYLPLWEEKSLVGADPSSQDVYMDVSLRTFPNSCYFADDYNVYYTDK